MTLPEGLSSATNTLASAVRVFVRRYPVVFAFGLGVSLQRFLSVRSGDTWPVAAGVVGDSFTLVLRLLFLVWVVRALLREPGLGGHVWSRLLAFSHRQWPVLVGHLVLVSLATLLFNNVLEGAAVLFPPSARPEFLAWLLAVKNVTVIPFTVIWLVTMVRDALRSVPGPTVREAAGATER